jgi:hypothetical protein
MAGFHNASRAITWCRGEQAWEATSHARWAAKIDGGTIFVFDPEGQLFKTIEVAPDVSNSDPFILPSCWLLGLDSMVEVSSVLKNKEFSDAYTLPRGKGDQRKTL